MAITKTQTGKTGADLSAELARPDDEDTPLVQELLYPGETTFLVADPAVGKSTLATQIALCVTCAHPVFDIFEVARPTTVYYIALETRWRRQVRLIRHLSRVIKPDLSKFHWNNPIGLDFTSTTTTDIKDMLELIRRIWQEPGLVVLDPLYLTVSKDLKDGSAARAVSVFLNRLMNDTEAACLVLHHTHRERLENGKKVVEDDAIYGSRWLQAHMAVGWQIKHTTNGTHWTLKKDRFNQSRREFYLNYDPQTQWSSGATSMKSSVTSKLQQVLVDMPEGTLLTYEELRRRTGSAIAYIKTLMHNDPQFLKFADYISNGPGKPAQWRVRPKREQPQPAPDTSAMDNLSVS